MRLSYYRDTTGKENHDQEKLLPHIDAGFITLVPVSDVPGLQVLDNDSFEWVKYAFGRAFDADKVRKMS